jgi:hypothetical protein
MRSERGKVRLISQRSLSTSFPFASFPFVPFAASGSIDYVRANKQRIGEIEGFAAQRKALEEMAPPSPPKPSKYDHVASRLAAAGATTRPARTRPDSAESAENSHSGPAFMRRTGSAASGGRRSTGASQQALPTKFNRPEVLPKKPSVPTREEILPMVSSGAETPTRADLYSSFLYALPLLSTFYFSPPTSPSILSLTTRR